MGIHDTDEQIADQDNRSAARSVQNVWNTITPGRKAYLESPEGQAETARAQAQYEAALAEKEQAKKARDEKNRLENNRKAKEARAARKKARK